MIERGKVSRHQLYRGQIIWVQKAGYGVVTGGYYVHRAAGSK